MKKLFILLFVFCITTTLESCYTTEYVTHYVSVIDDFNYQYLNKSKKYIIENFLYPFTDIKRLDDEYEVLICQRYRPLGAGITRFYLKKGICYNIETNEYKAIQSLEKVPLF